MIKIIAIVVAGLVAALLIFAATMPDTFRVERTASIKAPPEKIFSLIADFHRLGRLVTLGEAGPCIEANVQRP